MQTVIASDLAPGGPDRPVGDLSLWDDLGIGRDEDRPAGVHDQRSSRGPWRPTRRVVIFAAVLVAIGILLAVLMGRLLTLNPFVAVQNTPSPSGTAASTAPGSPATTPGVPGPASASPAKTTPASPTLGTPAMSPGAKECSTGIWAGPQTSCALALAAAAGVDKTMTGSTDVQAFSSTTNRTYTLRCVAGQGITCTGTGGVTGVYVWIVA